MPYSDEQFSVPPRLDISSITLSKNGPGKYTVKDQEGSVLIHEGEIFPQMDGTTVITDGKNKIIIEDSAKMIELLNSL